MHTHSRSACAWAQAGRDIPAYGTIHADYFYGPVPCMRGLTEDKIERAYELNTGKVICEGFAERDHARGGPVAEVHYGEHDAGGGARP